ncbi:hypothetical protein MP228_006371 [Amoeboaphelidium protococcarum]|nr:hypothetical protein MP228_006371 [Amoeboaphelidium protococcarum]
MLRKISMRLRMAGWMNSFIASGQEIKYRFQNLQSDDQKQLLPFFLKLKNLFVDLKDCGQSVDNSGIVMEFVEKPPDLTDTLH